MTSAAALIRKHAVLAYEPARGGSHARESVRLHGQCVPPMCAMPDLRHDASTMWIRPRNEAAPQRYVPCVAIDRNEGS